MRLVFVSSKIPYPAYRDGQTLILFHLLKHLAAEHDLTLLALAKEDETQAAEAIRAMGVKVVTVPKPRRTILQYYMGAAWKGEPWFGWKYMSAEFIRQVQAFDADPAVDGIVIHSPFLSPLLQYVSKKATVLNAIDELSAWFRQAAEHAWVPKALHLLLEARRAVKAERVYYSKARAITVVAERDRRHILSHAPGLPVAVIPNGVDTEKFRPLSSGSTETAIAFSGLMDYPPNVEAVMWFAQYVWPVLAKQNPKLVWKIIGAHPAPSVQALTHHHKGVRVTGFVEDLAAELATTNIAVVPVRTAAGFQNKILEALACGVPVVASREAVAGLPDGFQHVVHSAEDPSEWVQLITDLLPDSETHKRAARLVAEGYGWQAIAKRYEDVFVNAFQR